MQQRLPVLHFGTTIVNNGDDEWPSRADEQAMDWEQASRPV